MHLHLKSSRKIAFLSLGWRFRILGGLSSPTKHNICDADLLQDSRMNTKLDIKHKEGNFLLEGFFPPSLDPVYCLTVQLFMWVIVWYASDMIFLWSD